MARNVVFIGNCQADILGLIYREHIAPLKEQSVSYFHPLKERRDRARAIIRDADIVCAQDFAFQSILSADDLRESAKLIRFPMIVGAFLWPFGDQKHPRDQGTPGDRSPSFPWGLGNNYLNRLIEAGLDHDEALRRYLDLDIANEIDLDRLLEFGIQRLRIADAKTGFKTADNIERNFRDQRVFLNYGHITKPFLDLLARQLFEMLLVPSQQIERALAARYELPFGPGESPIHPSIIEHYSLKCLTVDSRYRHAEEGPFTFAEFVSCYLRYDWNRDLYKGVACASSDPAQALTLIEQGLQRSPRSFLGHWYQTRLLARLGRTEDAEAAALRAMQLEPDNPKGPSMLADVLRVRGDLAGAEAAARKAIELYPADALSYGSLISVLAQSGRIAEAVSVAQHALTLRPGSPEMQFVLGGLLLRSGDLSGAEQAFRAAVALGHPNQTGVRRALADVLHRRGNYPEAIDILRQLLAGNAADASLRVQLGQVLLQSGDFLGAEQALREAAEVNPNSPIILNALADLLMRQGKRAPAIEVLRQLVEAGGADPQIFLRLANILLQSSDLPGAEETLREAAARHSGSPAIGGALADVLLRQDKTAEAITVLRQLVANGTANAQTCLRLGQSLLRSGDFGDAEQALRKAVELDPAAPLARAMLAEVLARQGRQQEALGLLRQLVAERATDPQIYVRCGRMLMQEGDLESAGQTFRMALELNLSPSQFRRALLEVLIRQGREDDALVVVRELISEGMAAPQIYALIGRVMVEAGKLPNAEQAYRAAVKMDPNQGEYRLALANVLDRQRRPEEAFAALCELAVIGSESAAHGRRLDDGLRRLGGPGAAEEAVRKALAANPARSDYHLGLAELLQRQGRGGEALGLLLDFAKNEARDALVWARIGQLHEAGGDLAAAEQAFRRAIAINPAVTSFRTSLAGLLRRQARREAENAASGSRPAPVRAQLPARPAMADA